MAIFEILTADISQNIRPKKLLYSLSESWDSGEHSRNHCFSVWVSRFSTNEKPGFLKIFGHFFLVSEKFWTNCTFSFFHNYHRFPMLKTDNSLGGISTPKYFSKLRPQMPGPYYCPQSHTLSEWTLAPSPAGDRRWNPKILKTGGKNTFAISWDRKWGLESVHKTLRLMFNFSVGIDFAPSLIDDPNVLLPPVRWKLID